MRLMTQGISNFPSLCGVRSSLYLTRLSGGMSVICFGGASRTSELNGGPTVHQTTVKRALRPKNQPISRNLKSSLLKVRKEGITARKSTGCGTRSRLTSPALLMSSRTLSSVSKFTVSTILSSYSTPSRHRCTYQFATSYKPRSLPLRPSKPKRSRCLRR